MEGGPVAGSTLSESLESRLASPTEAQSENQRVSREGAKLAKKEGLGPTMFVSLPESILK